MKLYRKGRLETAHDQSWSAGALTLGAWLLFGLGIGLTPSALVPTMMYLTAIFTACISAFMIGLFFHVNPVLTLRERQKFLNVIWGFAFFVVLFRFAGSMLFLAIPSVFNLIAVIVFRTLQRT